MTDDQIQRAIDALNTVNVVNRAELTALKKLLLHICQSIQLSTVQGRPTPQWLNEEIVAALEKQMILAEDKNPARAAQMQAILDSVRRRSGGSHS